MYDVPSTVLGAFLYGNSFDPHDHPLKSVITLYLMGKPAETQGNEMT